MANVKKEVKVKGIVDGKEVTMNISRHEALLAFADTLGLKPCFSYQRNEIFRIEEGELRNYVDYTYYGGSTYTLNPYFTIRDEKVVEAYCLLRKLEELVSKM